ncbi:MAG: hypothetical protein H6658_17730 [Ardenticatenaceae bacterium]|nr:hypothetical protein [Ardenticatenaceae bacterium]
MYRKSLLFICVMTLLLLGCSDPGTNGADDGAATTPVRSTLAPLNTLVPTFTPLPNVQIPVTLTPVPGAPETAVDPTATINFEEITVQLIYQIPALGLDRVLEGNVAGQISVYDRAVPLGMQRSNQGNILLDLQRRLPEIELAPLPTDCETCVLFQYSLPLEGDSRAGWLQDPVILASVENYMTALVGPHFPPNTAVGLRREATFYYPAHSIALLADGRIVTWLATEAQIDEPFPSPLSFSQILTDLPLTELQSSYAANCLPEPIETLRIYTNSEPIDIIIRCPAYALPTTLLPLYWQLDQLLAEKLAAYEGPERPPTGLPLAAVLDYQRLDGNQLTVLQNGRVTVQNNSQIVYTGTITTTDLISLTTNLLDSGQLQPGLTTVTTGAAESTPTAADTPDAAPTPEAAVSILLVRGPQGILDGEFTVIDLPFLRDLNELLDTLLAPPDPTATPALDPESTPEIEATPTTAVEDTPTPTPSS